MIAALRADGVRTVVWVDAVGEPRLARRPVPARRRVGAAAPRARRPTTRARDGHFVARRRRRAVRGALVDGHRLAGRLHLAAAEAWWREQAKRVLELGVRGHQGRRRRGLVPPRRRALRRRHAPAREAAWGHGLRYRRSMQRALDEVHPGDGRAVRPPRLDRPAGGRDDLGRRPAVGLLVAADARRGDADRRRVGLLELVARRRRLPRRAARWRAARRSCCCAGCSSAASRR